MPKRFWGILVMLIQRLGKLALVIFVLKFTLSPLGLLASDRNENSRLNVLFITVDTLRADKLGCYGNKVIPTPNIDALAKKGAIFTRAFAHNPLTLPSHANIFLGTTPLYHGVHDNMNFIVREDFLTLAEHLKSQGYQTGAVMGAFPLDSRFGLDQGFDFYEDDFKKKGAPKYALGERKAEVVIQIAMDWLDRQTSPWFLWMHIWDPHFSYEPPQPFLSRYKEKAYDGEVAYVDYVLGTFFQSVAAKDLMDKTLVVFTSDHGESLGDHGEKTHGMFAYNATIWVPLIITAPRLEPKKITQHVSHSDIFPTVCDILGLEKPDFLQGISLVPAMQKKKIADRKIYFESLEPYYNFGWAPLRGFIHTKEKFIDSPIPEFYDLGMDFGENRNLGEDMNLSRLRSDLKSLIRDLSPSGSADAKKKYDFKTLQKLRSLGYVGFRPTQLKESFSRADDIKTLLPLLNKCFEAYGYGDEGDPDKGIELLQRMIRQNVRIYQPYVYLAKLYHETGKTNEAIPVLEKGLRKHPKNYEIFRYYAQYLGEVAQHRSVIELMKASGHYQKEQDPVIWNILGKSYNEIGEFREAIEVLERAVSIDREFADAFSNLGSSYLSLSYQTEDENMYFKALDNLKKALALDPKHEEASYNLGLAYLRVGDFQEAIHYFEEALGLGIQRGKIFFDLGVAYLSQGNLTKACRYFRTYKDEYMPLLSEAEKKSLASYLRRCEALKKIY